VATAEGCFDCLSSGFGCTLIFQPGEARRAFGDDASQWLASGTFSQREKGKTKRIHLSRKRSRERRGVASHAGAK